MPEAYIVDAVRTPVGKKNGGLSTAHPADLGAHVLKDLVTRTGIDPAACRFVANYLAGFREATKTPVSTSAKPMMWNSCGRSPRKTMAIADPNTGTT